MKRSIRAILITLPVGLCAALLATGAAAEAGLTVTGEAYYGTDGIQFVITNDTGHDAFFDLKYGGDYLARHMVCGPGETPVGWELAGGEDPARYTLTAYTGRTPDGTASELSGSGIYADLGGKLALMATYPGFDGGEAYPPNSTYYDTAAEADYDLADPTAAAVAGGWAYRYRPYVPAALTGSVSYVDGSGAVLGSVTLDGITEANPVSYPIPESLSFGGAVYFPGVRSVTAVYGGQTDFVVLCTKQAVEGDGAYQAVIKMVDETGKLLMTDHLNVSRVYTYSLPETFVLTGVGTATSYTYQPREGEGSVFTMRPGDAGNAATKEYSFTYAGHTENTDIDWRIRKINGVTGALLGTETITVAPGETARYTAADLTVDGTAYTAAGSKTYSYRYGGSNLLQTVYYVPAGFVPDAAYNITVHYVNIADKAVLHSETVPVTPDKGATVTSPAVYGEYVRLDGQSDSSPHNYFSPKRDYIVYYRHINDTLYADTEITLTQTVTTTRTAYNVITLPAADEGVTLATAGAGGSGASGTATVSGAAGNLVYAAGPAEGEELTAANNATTGESRLLNEQGQDTAEARDELIAENEAPLAQGDDNTLPPLKAEPVSGVNWRSNVWVALGLLALALLALIARQAVKSRHDRL